MQKAHGVDNRNRVSLVKFPLCEKEFKTLTNVCKHIPKQQKIQLLKETMAFNSLHGRYLY